MPAGKKVRSIESRRTTRRREQSGVYPASAATMSAKAPPSRKEREKGRAPSFICVVKAWASPLFVCINVAHLVYL